MVRFLAFSLAAVFAVTGALGSSRSASHPSPATHPRAARPAAVMHYTHAQRLLIGSIDLAAGKAVRATMSSDGLFEGRSASSWCIAASDAEQALVRGHSLAWADKVDHARDAESRTFQAAAKACG